ncbi:MAG: PQQ-dependent sugar dehydrogenase [Desulfobacterales bacterium]
MNIFKINILAFVLGLNSIFVSHSNGITLRSQTLTVNGQSIELKVPSGLKVEFLAALSSPRFLSLGPNEEIIIGSAGNHIFRLKEPYTVPEILVSLPGINHSVIYREGQLFVAETAGLYTAAYSGSDTSLDASDFKLYVRLPSATGGHWSRTVIVGPDNRLYISIGISGNCSDEYLDESYPFERRRGGVFVVDETVNPPQIIPYASGLRNPIGIAFNPETSMLYASNAGPDNLGYSQPPEVFSALSDHSFHGMPWFQYYNDAFRSGECATSPAPRPSSEATPPSATFEARSTPQGITFVTNTFLSDYFDGNALVAIHGSWAVAPGGGPETRRPPKIVMVKFFDGQPIDVEDIVTGFQRSDGSRFARPSGMLMGPDGQLYFTSDAGSVTGLFRLGPTSKGINIAPIYELLLH